MSTAKTSKPAAEAVPAKSQAFRDHIAELRSRFTWIAVVFIVASALAYNFRQPLIDAVLGPLGDQQLVYLTPGGGFAFIFQIMLYAGALIASPVLIFHIYRFVKPALPGLAAKKSLRMLLASITLMVMGVTFGYFVAIPSALHFLTEFAGDFVDPNLTADSYLGFVMAYVVGLGILFQLPLLLIIVNWINPLPPSKLLNSQRFIILFAFIAAAIITPTPDLLNQSMVAGPIILIYQLGVVAVLISNRQLRRAQKIAKRKAAASAAWQQRQAVELAARRAKQAKFKPSSTGLAGSLAANRKKVLSPTAAQRTPSQALSKWPKLDLTAQVAQVKPSAAPTLKLQPANRSRRQTIEGFVSANIMSLDMISLNQQSDTSISLLDLRRQ